MTDMIERVTQALREVLWNYGVQLTKEMDELLARAAIEAMREPTEEMSHAGWRTDSGIGTVVWQAMIDAALHKKE